MIVPPDSNQSDRIKCKIILTESLLTWWPFYHKTAHHQGNAFHTTSSSIYCIVCDERRRLYLKLPHFFGFVFSSVCIRNAVRIYTSLSHYLHIHCVRQPATNRRELPLWFPFDHWQCRQYMCSHCIALL